MMHWNVRRMLSPSPHALVGILVVKVAALRA